MTTTWDGCDANPIEVVGKGFSVGPEWNGDGVEFTVEYDDSTWAGRHTRRSATSRSVERTGMPSWLYQRSRM
jgi:hypothetical protein